jgi:signal transduction histidine kinase
MRAPRSLRSRLFRSFFGAIVVAIATGVAIVAATRPESSTGIEMMAHHVAARLALSWDDAEATRAYVGEIQDATGFEVKLVRDVHKLPRHVHGMAQHGVFLAPDGPTHVFVPVVRDGKLLGALEMDRLGHRLAPWAWWRFAVALALVVAVLSATAGRVADRLSRPLERLAEAADRLGSGDLSFRADVGAQGARTSDAHGCIEARGLVREVHTLGVAFNRMADRIEAMVRGQRELLGAISHELRSPLGRARVALEIARDRLADPSPARAPAAALDDVDKQLTAIDAILGDLLDVTRAGLADLRRETRPFVAWLRAVVAEEPEPPAIELDAAPASDDVALAFDVALLGRAVHNLLVNARAHGHPDGEPLRVSVSREGGRLRVVVRDRGPGFAPGLAERAFEPFVRGDAARARPAAGTGYGLGLAIVRRVVEAHGGRAFARNVASEEGVAGAETGFELPIAGGLSGEGPRKNT